jgi:hypothetical protein
MSGIPIPKKHTIINWNLHYQNAGRLGAITKLSKYGKVTNDEEYRKEMWKKWWEKEGKYRAVPKGFITTKQIKIPKKSKILAEFIGILLGDGHISKYQVGITLSSDEKQYRGYVAKLVFKLFGITPTIVNHKSRKATTIVVSRKSLVEFCQKFGFVGGNNLSDFGDPTFNNKATACFRLDGSGNLQAVHNDNSGVATVQTLETSISTKTQTGLQPQALHILTSGNGALPSNSTTMRILRQEFQEE